MILRSFISPVEVHANRLVKYADVAALAAPLNRAEPPHLLAFLNLLLSAALTETSLKGNLEPIRDLQTWLLESA
jgi:hypothetical protein